MSPAQAEVVLVRTHSAVPMGMQLHEEWLAEALSTYDGAGLAFRHLTVSSWRAASASPGVRRVPGRLTDLLDLRVARPINRVLYGSADLYHRLDLRLPRPSGRGLVTVHDLPFLHFGDEGKPTPRQIASARGIGVICPSHFAAAEVMDVLKPRRTWVISNGLSPHLVTGSESAAPVPPSWAPPRYVLNVGGVTARKNLHSLAEAWTLLKAKTDLPHVLLQCGPHAQARERLFSSVPDVLIVDRQEPAVIAALMRSAEAVVVPSTYEGFGLPALEGMAAGVPVVAAARGALPEVCGDAALLTEPDGASLCDALVHVLTDERLRAELGVRGRRRAAAFTWTRAAAETVAAYREVLRW